MFDYRFEPIGGGFRLCVTREHTFGTDAFLLAWFAQVRKKDRVCDLGTGCGIIPALMVKNGAAGHIYGVDIQPMAIEQLRLSIEQNHWEDIITPVCEDLTAHARLREYIPPGSCDVVTCNPPYKALGSGLTNAQDAATIARHEVKCTIYDVAQTAALLLKHGGRFFICHRPERLCDCIDAMRKSGIEPKAMRFVQKKSDTAPWLVLIEGKKGAKPFLKVLPSLFTSQSQHDNSEFSKIYTG